MQAERAPVERTEYAGFNLTPSQARLMYLVCDKIVVDLHDSLVVDTNEPDGIHRGTIRSLARLDLIEATEDEGLEGVFYVTLTPGSEEVAEAVWKTGEHTN